MGRMISRGAEEEYVVLDRFKSPPGRQPQQPQALDLMDLGKKTKETSNFKMTGKKKAKISAIFFFSSFLFPILSYFLLHF